jgi:type I restriction enzyme R subunit
MARFSLARRPAGAARWPAPQAWATITQPHGMCRAMGTTPEALARQKIDERLQAAGWQVQDMKAFNLGAGRGVAVREYPTDTGPADYVLFVDRQPVGVIEAKRDEAGEALVVAETQTERYAASALK